MHILITGTNAPQVGSERVPLKYATGCKALVNTLRALGHDVDQRGVYPGDKTLYKYDRVICYLNPMNALTAQWSFGVLWLLHERPDTIVALDDWQTRQILTGARSQARDPSRLYREILNRKGRDLLTPQIQKAMEKSLQTLAQQPWPWRLLAPVFPYGDVSKLGLQAADYWRFDPSSYWRGFYDQMTPKTPTDARLRQWVSASLLSKQDWLDKLRPTWEVIKLGNKKQGQLRVKEDAVVRAYAQSWGVLSAPHAHAGSGWWRARFIFAADARAVLYGDPREVSAFGNSYCRTLDEIENLSEKGLFDLARNQALELNQNTWTEEQLKDALTTLVAAS